MEERLEDLVRRRLRPLVPRPTGETPRLPALPGIRAFVFDVYGTLLISASGDVGLEPDDVPAPARAFRDAAEAIGLSSVPDAERAILAYREALERSHARSKASGVPYPEVDALAIWRETFERLGAADAFAAEAMLRRFVLEYELRANPIWPMPNCRETLAAIRAVGAPLGIVSNAQFYTPISLSAVLDADLPSLGFDEELCFYSFEHGRAKPGTHLYELAAEAFRKRGIATAEILYVGNDLLNDALPASQVGFRTALFAGDARSLRKRESDERVRGFQADVVVTDLAQLLTYLPSSER
jgi:putative hydrolase of the HAD superfamily